MKTRTDLIEFFKNIANAIRTKKGTTDKIAITDFANEIESISGGAEKIVLPRWIEISDCDVNTDTGELILPSEGVEIFPNWLLNADWSKVIIFRMNYPKLKILPLLDLSNSHVLGACSFNGCASLEAIPQLDTSNLRSMQEMFLNCSKLVSIPVLSTNNVYTMENAFQGCTKLSNESLNNIMQMCINATNYSTGLYDRRLSTIGLTEEQAEICKTLSNYQAFLDAGWTTGY